LFYRISTVSGIVAGDEGVGFGTTVDR